MSINAEIMAAVTPIVSECCPDIYDGSAKEFCTFNMTELPIDNGDNAPHAIRYLVQVHYFLPLRSNGTAVRRQLKNALLSAGFTYPSVTNASDDVSQHYVLECEYADGDV